MGPDLGAPGPDAESGPGESAKAETGAQPSTDQSSADQSAPDQAAAGQATAGSATAGSGRKRKRKRPLWRDLAAIIVAALLVTILLKTFVVQVFSIPSGSMENTLMPGDRILVSKVVYDFRSIQRGDVVVFNGAGSWDPQVVPSGNPAIRYLDDLRNLIGSSSPGVDYVKRVIGIPGDHVVCCDAQGRITVNGVPLNEKSYIYPGAVPSQQKFNIVVPAGRLWVMGDNRADSDDSRYRLASPGDGTVPESAVVGRAFLIIWPLSRFNDIPIPSTFAQKGFQAAAAVAAAPPATVAGGTAALSGAALFWRRRRRRRR